MDLIELTCAIAGILVLILIDIFIRSKIQNRWIKDLIGIFSVILALTTSVETSLYLRKNNSDIGLATKYTFILGLTYYAVRKSYYSPDREL